MTKAQIQQRLEYLRGEIEVERISTEEIAELQSLAKYIDKGDVLLLQWAGVPEFEDKTQTQKTIDYASELYKAMDWLQVDDGSKRVVITPRSGEIHDFLLELTYKVSKDTSLGNDSIYEFTMVALGQIADSVAEDKDGLYESIYEIEGDVYTSDLTEWLNESNYHVEYLTEAMQEYSPNDGFQLLALAQSKAKQEVAGIVLEALWEATESEE